MSWPQKQWATQPAPKISHHRHNFCEMIGGGQPAHVCVWPFAHSSETSVHHETSVSANMTAATETAATTVATETAMLTKAL